jgi:hypothetical protein
MSTYSLLSSSTLASILGILLCYIWGSRSGKPEDCCILEYDTVEPATELPTFRSTLLPPSVEEPSLKDKHLKSLSLLSYCCIYLANVALVCSLLKCCTCILTADWSVNISAVNNRDSLLRVTTVKKEFPWSSVMNSNYNGSDHLCVNKYGERLMRSRLYTTVTAQQIISFPVVIMARENSNNSVH